MPASLYIKKLSVYIFLATCLFITGVKGQESAVQPQKIYSSDFEIDGIPRTISFYIPLNYGKSDTYPLVFFLHAEGETGKAVIKKYGGAIQQLADSSACIVVYPDAVKGHWNTKIGDHAATDSINDVGFITIMIDYFVQQYHCDPARVYAAGFYNGGEMAWRLSCNSPNKVTAIAPFIPLVQAVAKTCTTGACFNAEKFMPQPGKKFSGDALAAAWKFLMDTKKP